MRHHLNPCNANNRCPGTELLVIAALACTMPTCLCTYYYSPAFFVLTVAENQRLTLNFTSQEEDRALLVRQLVIVKRSNARFKEELAQLKESMGKEDDKQNKFQRQASSHHKQQNNSDANVRSFLFALVVNECVA